MGSNIEASGQGSTIFNIGLSRRVRILKSGNTLEKTFSQRRPTIRSDRHERGVSMRWHELSLDVVRSAPNSVGQIITFSYKEDSLQWTAIAELVEGKCRDSVILIRDLCYCWPARYVTISCLSTNFSTQLYWANVIIVVIRVHIFKAAAAATAATINTNVFHHTSYLQQYPKKHFLSLPSGLLAGTAFHITTTTAIRTLLSGNSVGALADGLIFPDSAVVRRVVKVHL